MGLAEATNFLIVANHTLNFSLEKHSYLLFDLMLNSIAFLEDIREKLKKFINFVRLLTKRKKTCLYVIIYTPSLHRQLINPM